MRSGAPTSADFFGSASEMSNERPACAAVGGGTGKPPPPTHEKPLTVGSSLRERSDMVRSIHYLAHKASILIVKSALFMVDVDAKEKKWSRCAGRRAGEHTEHTDE